MQNLLVLYIPYKNKNLLQIVSIQSRTCSWLIDIALGKTTIETVKSINKWNTKHIINFQLDLCLIVFFVFTIYIYIYIDFIKHLIESEKHGDMKFLLQFAQNLVKIKFW